MFQLQCLYMHRYHWLISNRLNLIYDAISDSLFIVIQKPGGIIALLDETCMLRNSTHETFAEKLYQQFKGNQHFSRPKFSRSDFTIHHYAGHVSVIYFFCLPTDHFQDC
jgi:sigma54-dependent transcription regulator